MPLAPHYPIDAFVESPRLQALFPLLEFFESYPGLPLKRKPGLAAAATWGLAGLTAGALNGLSGGTFLERLCTAFQTFVLTALAMLLALCGMTWKRRELIWLVYPWMALAAYKLLVQDLRRGQTLSLFVSLFLYGGALILLPRIVQRSSAPS